MNEHHNWYNGSVWHIDWPYQVYVGQWSIFYGPAILLHILKTIWWRNVVVGIMDQCDSMIDLVKYMWVNDLYFMVHLILPYIIVRLELFLYIKKWHRPGVFFPLRALALVVMIHCLPKSSGVSNVKWDISQWVMTSDFWQFITVYTVTNFLHHRVRCRVIFTSSLECWFDEQSLHFSAPLTCHQNKIYHHNTNGIILELPTNFFLHYFQLTVLDVQSGLTDHIPSLKSSDNSTPAACPCGIHSIAINPSKTMLATGAENTNDLAVYKLPTFDPVCVGEVKYYFIMNTHF